MLANLTSAYAQVYSFNQFLSGGAGGAHLERKRIVTTAGQYVCLSITPGTTPNTARFMIQSRIPQPASRIVAIAIDLGRYSNLIRSVDVLLASQGVKAKVVPAKPHGFLRGMNISHLVEVAQRGHLNPEGLGPGRMVTLSATLGDGVTLAQLIQAINAGTSTPAEARGLRVGVIINYLAGGPPPGVGTISDDGGFATTTPSAACR